MTNPTTVLIAKEFVASTKVESLTPGQLTIVGAQKDVLTASDKTAFLALKKANGQVLFSPAIHAANIDVIEASAYIPPIEEQAIVDFTDADVFNGHEYVIRLVYKDIYDHPGQFTQTYRALLGVNSGSTPTVGDKVALAKKFVAAINRKDSYSPIDKSTSRITASQIAGGTDLVVAAKADLPTVIPADGTTAYAIAEDQIFTVTAGA
jgi:hypothetical protein